MDYERFIQRIRSSGFSISISEETRHALREFTRNTIVDDGVSRDLFSKALREDEFKTFFIHELVTRILFLARPPVYLYCRQRFEEAMRILFSNIFFDRGNPQMPKRFGKHGLTMLAFEFFVGQVIEDMLTHQHLEDSWDAG